MPDDQRAKKPRLPWIGAQELKYTLLAAAKKVESGEPLLTGESRSGGRYIERDIAVAALRAVAEGESGGKVFRRGPRPTHHWDILRQVHMARKKSKTLAGAFEKVAKDTGKSAAAIKKAYQRAQEKERQSYRKKYLEGAWPTWGHWDMSDDDIEQYLKENPFNFVDSKGEPVDLRKHLQQRRAGEIEEMLRLTGWKVLPVR